MSASMQDYGNRLRKRQRHLRKWAKRQGIDAYRLYDRDIPDQPVVVEWYAGEAVLWAYRRTRNETAEDEQQWLRDLQATTCAALDITPQHYHCKRRFRQQGNTQYQRLDRQQQTKLVHEHGLVFEVNLHDFMDTGLFLDHRPLRQRLRAEAADKHVLNLFCYTGSFTVNAAAGDAASTTSVDLSSTYLDWCKRNLTHNQLMDSRRHQLHRGDVRDYLLECAASPKRFDRIICDPPTFSNSKRTEEDFVVADDHPALIRACLRVLAPGGVLYFSTNFRGFRLAHDALPHCSIEDITASTIPEDVRDPKAHYCWQIRSP